jgi:hypothetical protein
MLFFGRSTPSLLGRILVCYTTYLGIIINIFEQLEILNTASKF